MLQVVDDNGQLAIGETAARWGFLSFGSLLCGWRVITLLPGCRWRSPGASVAPAVQHGRDHAVHSRTGTALRGGALLTAEPAAIGARAV